jgi:hypothetical protein
VCSPDSHFRARAHIFAARPCGKCAPAQNDPSNNNTLQGSPAANAAPTVNAAARMVDYKEHAEERRQERLQRFRDINRNNTELSTAVRFPVVLADPPYFFETYASADANERAPEYPTMTVQEISALPVRELATDARRLVPVVPIRILNPTSSFSDTDSNTLSDLGGLLVTNPSIALRPPSPGFCLVTKTESK